ncbi:MAG: bis(5'-nucleosyl)-tetraphosphatase (symmetrical) YqeK [Oscillospiraceae bacterium]|nr:bis(5'-nucleosyl)-tetraphosphatase (symmetrical) YqeK [Oscillospiraceae bacterium]
MGGTFNPPHIGHEYLLSSMRPDFDKVIVIPTGDPPHKELDDGSASGEQRLAMAKAAFPDAEISDIEVRRAGKSYTADTIRELMEYYPVAKFSLLMGDDMFRSLPKWYDYEWLSKNVTFIHQSREIVHASSTEVRELLPQRKGRELVSPDVYAYIVKHRLYGVKPDFDWLRQAAAPWYDAERIPHIKGTEIAAVELAERWGADVDDARTAAILHDVTKKLDYENNLTLAEKYDIMTDVPEFEDKQVFHAITGAAVAYHEFGVSEEIRGAIRWHTTGKANMTLLEKIIYLADCIEETREYSDLAECRAFAFENLDAALRRTMERVLESVYRRGLKQNKYSIEAIEYLDSHGGL